MDREKDGWGKGLVHGWMVRGETGVRRRGMDGWMEGGMNHIMDKEKEGWRDE